MSCDIYIYIYIYIVYMSNLENSNFERFIILLEYNINLF